MQNKYICYINGRHSVKFFLGKSKTNNVCKKILSQETKSKGNVLGREIGSLLFSFLSPVSIFMWCPPIHVCACVNSKLALCSQFYNIFSPVPFLTICQAFLLFCKQYSTSVSKGFCSYRHHWPSSRIILTLKRKRSPSLSIVKGWYSNKHKVMTLI